MWIHCTPLTLIKLNVNYFILWYYVWILIIFTGLIPIFAPHCVLNCTKESVFLYSHIYNLLFSSASGDHNIFTWVHKYNTRYILNYLGECLLGVHPFLFFLCKSRREITYVDWNTVWYIYMYFSMQLYPLATLLSKSRSGFPFFIVTVLFCIFFHLSQ